MKIELEPVGFVRGGRSEARDDEWGGTVVAIELAEGFEAEALAGLAEFSHVEVLFFFDRVAPEKVQRGARHPRNNRAWPQIGIFAQRGKNRPNRLGSCIARVLGVEGRRLRVAELDAMDGTPVVDLKPVMQEFLPRGPVSQPDWSRELMARYWVPALAAPTGLSVREERPGEGGAVEALVAAAFGSDAEAVLVARLRGEPGSLSLVAELAGELVGHVLFSPVELEGRSGLPWAALGPLAVAPACQGRGIGARLVREGLERAAARGDGAVFLAGNPRYYERFGFRSAAEAGLHYPNPALDPAFQVAELVAGALRGQTGVVRFHPAFDEAE